MAKQYKTITLNFLIQLYTIIKKMLLIPEGTCRFIPSCSIYAKDAFNKYSIPKATILTIWRIIRCNPFSKGGYDPANKER